MTDIDLTALIDDNVGNKQANKYSRYINKTINSLNKTQSKIFSCKEWLKSTSKKPYRPF